MKHAVEIGSVAMICIPSFIKVDIGGYTNTQTGWSSHKATSGKYAKTENV
jgi:hypothetical protein